MEFVFRTLLLIRLLVYASTSPQITLHRSYNNAFNVARDQKDSLGGTVKFLGYFETQEECEAKCLHVTERCWYFVYFPTLAGDADSSLQQQCFSVTSPGWNPSYDESSVTGVVHWGCRDNLDCSLNGECNDDSVCECRPAWNGERCETLNVLPTSHTAGYRGTDDGKNTTSWGGSVLPGSDGLYHMWAAEMTEHCGIGAWSQNSRIVHATSKEPQGPYERQNVVYEVFSHEPEVVPGPDGEYVMFFTASLRSEHGDCNCCREGTPCDGSTGPSDCPDDVFQQQRRLNSDPSWMSFTLDPNSNFSEPQPIFADYTGSDTNFAPIILRNGSLVALWREWTFKGGSRVYLATAEDWKDTDNYVRHDKRELFPDLGAAGTEDPFVYLDDEGNYHAIFHHMYGSGTEDQWWLDATGGHAFSRDGWEWTYSGVCYGNATARYNTDEGQGADVKFEEGDTFKFTRLERPHLLFQDGNDGKFDGPGELRGDGKYLINAAQYGMGKDPGTGAQNDDACYTLVQPINPD